MSLDFAPNTIAIAHKLCKLNPVGSDSPFFTGLAENGTDGTKEPIQMIFKKN